MTWRTHMAVGANAIWLIPLLGAVDQSILVLLPVAAISGILPDIDHAGGAKIHYVGGGVLGLFRGMFFGKYFHHRGLMHSVFVGILLTVALAVVFSHTYPLLPQIFFASFLSHSVIDGFNTVPVGYFYPFNLKRFFLLPKALRTYVKGPVDNLLFVFGVFGLLLFFIFFQNKFLPGM